MKLAWRDCADDKPSLQRKLSYALVNPILLAGFYADFGLNEVSWWSWSLLSGCAIYHLTQAVQHTSSGLNDR